MVLSAEMRSFGSARESVEMYDWRGFRSLSQLTAAVAVAVGMWKPASFAGFQAPRAGRTVVAECCILPPSGRHFHSEARFIGHSVENVLFGRPTERKYVPFRKPRRNARFYRFSLRADLSYLS
jgi:hypothetical protein